MKKVFIGGSRRISRLNADLRSRIDEIMNQRLCVLVGDSNGADKAVLTYLSERHYPNVTVFCSGGHCRNNVAGWPVTSVTPANQIRDFAFFTAKALAMAREADVGLMVWDGKSTGTMVNAARMVAAHKPVVVHVSPGKHFSTVRSYSDLDELLSHCPSDIRRRIHGYIAEHAGDYAQSGLFRPQNEAEIDRPGPDCMAGKRQGGLSPKGMGRARPALAVSRSPRPQ
jgi:hypothetical protein